MYESADCVNVIKHIQHSLGSFLNPIDLFNLNLVAKQLFEINYLKSNPKIPSLNKHVHMYTRYLNKNTNFVHSYTSDLGSLIIKRSNNTVTLCVIRLDNVSPLKENHTYINTGISINIHIENKPLLISTIETYLQDIVWSSLGNHVHTSIYPKNGLFSNFLLHCAI